MHDVSKHRETIYTGGKCRSDPPPNYFDSLGIGDNSTGQILYSPHEEIILKDAPKLPRGKRVPIAREDHDTLEELVPKFLRFLENSGELALNDSKKNISVVSL